MNKDEVVGKVLGLFLSKKGYSARVPKQRIKVDENGILGDKFYAKEPNRSLLVTSFSSYQMAMNKGIMVGYGKLGENIIIDYNPYHLPVGTEIKIGDTILQITQLCTICKSLTKIDSQLPKLLKRDRGVFVKVVKSGAITIDDKVSINYINLH